MNKVLYYKDTDKTVGQYALKLMTNIFGICTPTKRVAEYFKYPQWLVEEWIQDKRVPEEEALKIITQLTKEQPEAYIKEISQAVDFIKGD